MSRWIALFTGLALLIGCGPKVELNLEPTTVSGKLTAAGAPVGNVLLTLQPLETGHPVPIKVGSDGSFKADVIPGKYAYFVAAIEDNSSAIDKVPADFRQASLTRTVTVSAGQTTLEVPLK